MGFGPLPPKGLRILLLGLWLGLEPSSPQRFGQDTTNEPNPYPLPYFSAPQPIGGFAVDGMGSGLRVPSPRSSQPHRPSSLPSDLTSDYLPFAQPKSASKVANRQQTKSRQAKKGQISELQKSIQKNGVVYVKTQERMDFFLSKPRKYQVIILWTSSHPKCDPCRAHESYFFTNARAFREQHPNEKSLWFLYIDAATDPDTFQQFDIKKVPTTVHVKAHEKGDTDLATFQKEDVYHATTPLAWSPEGLAQWIRLKTGKPLDVQNPEGYELPQVYHDKPEGFEKSPQHMVFPVPVGQEQAGLFQSFQTLMSRYWREAFLISAPILYGIVKYYKDRTRSIAVVVFLAVMAGLVYVVYKARPAASGLPDIRILRSEF